MESFASECQYYLMWPLVATNAVSVATFGVVNQRCQPEMILDHAVVSPFHSRAWERSAGFPL